MRNIHATMLWAWRDLRGGWRHFRLVVMCLVLSLMAITAVQLTGNSVLRSIHENGQTILGGDWVLRQIYTPVGEEERDYLRNRGGVFAETIEARVMLRAVKNDESALVELKAIDQAYPLYGVFTTTPEDASLQDGLVLDKMLGERLNVAVGDMIAVGETELPVTGWIDHEPDRAGSGRFGLAPRVFINKENLKKSGLLQPGSMIYHDLRVKFSDDTDLKKLKKDISKKFPDSTWRLSDSDNASPQIRRFVNNVVQFLTLVGLSALLIGGIGVANGMRAYLDTRLGAIALFKTLGMSQAQIRLVFLWQILLIGCTGVGIGILLGIVLPLAAAPFIQPLLPFPFTLHVTGAELIVPVLFGLLTTAVFALWPLGQAERTPALLLFRNALWVERLRPRRSVLLAMGMAISALGVTIILDARDPNFAGYFVIGALICFGVFYGFGKLLSVAAHHYAGKAHLTMRMALHNLGRVGNATAQTLVSIGIGLTVLVTIVLIEKNLSATLRDNLPEDAPAFFFLDIQPNQKDDFVALLQNWPTARNVIATPNLRGRIVSVNGVPAAEALKDKKESWLLNNDRGFTYMQDMPAHSDIIAGEWWPKDYQGPPLISVVDDVQRGFGVKPGDTMELMILGRTFEATIANVREVNWTTFTINFAITFAPGPLDGAPHNWLSTVVADPLQEAAIQRAVTKQFPNISMVRVSDAVRAVEDMLGQMNQAVRVMAILAVLTGIFVLAGALMATRMQRIYDVVILKVLGASRSILQSALFIELALLGFASAGIAILFGTIISWSVLGVFMDLPWAFYPLHAVMAAAIGWAFIILTGWLTLGRVLRSPAAPYLRNE